MAVVFFWIFLLSLLAAPFTAGISVWTALAFLLISFLLACLDL